MGKGNVDYLDIARTELDLALQAKSDGQERQQFDAREMARVAALIAIAERLDLVVSREDQSVRVTKLR